MKPIPKPLYPCKHHSWRAVDLNWSEIEQDWVCEECWDERDCWDERFSEGEPKGICLADEIKNQKESE